MSVPAGFRFVDDAAGFVDPGALAAHVPANVRSKRALLTTLAGELRFPGYFGHNWDALDECLRDLSWLPGQPNRVVIVHRSLPLRNPKHRRIYLQTLRDAIASWSAKEGRQLLAIFPADARASIERLLSES